MSISKSESRLPFNFLPNQLGENQADAANKMILISYYASPLAIGREQTYVLMITDATLQASFHSVRWQVGNTDQTNQESVWNHTHNQSGPVTVNVTVFNNTGGELGRISLNQTVQPLNQSLENLIELDDQTHPVADDPVTSREIINDLLPHIHSIKNVGTHESENKMLFGVSYVAALNHRTADREQLINRLRTHVNSNLAADFYTDSAPGAGICRLRPEILAMTYASPASPLIPWQLLPSDAAQRTTSLATLRTTLAGLTQDNMADLFNLMRFPKASLTALDAVISNIRTQLFSGDPLDTIMGNSTNATDLFNHLIHGPNAPNSTLPANAMTPNSIIGRMIGPLWQQVARVAPTVPSTTGNAVLGTVPSLFGTPERVPELTYIVNALPNDNGYITSATNYHQTYGLNPQNFTSLQGLVQTLAGSSSHINRLRIVGHAGLNPSNEANLFAAFFNTGPRVITRAMLKGFGENDEKGLRAILDPTGFENPTAPVYQDLVGQLLNVLYNLHPEVMTPFGTVTSANLTGDFKLLMYYCSDILFARLGTITANGTDITNTNRNRLKASLLLLYNFVRDRIGGTTVSTGTRAVTNGELDTLRTTIDGYTVLQISCFSVRPFPVFNSIVNPILSALRANSAHSTLLGKFCLQTNGPASGSTLETFLKICSDLLTVRLLPAADLQLDGQAFTNAQRTALTNALNSAADKIKTQLANTTICSTAPASVTDTDINALKTAILALSMDDINMASLGSRSFVNPVGSTGYTATTGRDEDGDGVDDPAPVTIFDILNTANTAIGSNWRQHLNSTKNRFDENSWIDIRGCRIGQDRSYLDAVRDFFGRPGHLPAVSGPEWWQSFPQAGFVVNLADEAAVDGLFGNGDTSVGQNHSDLDITTVFDRVRTLSGVDQHISFWKTVADFSNFQFVAMVWKGGLQPLPMRAPRLSDFGTINFTQTIQRISEIFNLGASLPANATLTRIQNKHSAIAALQTEKETIQQLTGQASPLAADITASHGRLLAVSNDLGQTTVPASPPAGLTVAQLTAWATTLSGFVDTSIIGGGNNNTEINTFRQALRTKVNIPESNDQTAAGNGRSDFRYYFFCGLTLLVDKLNNWCFYSLNTHLNASIRSFMQVHWQDALPSGNLIAASTMNQNRSRQLSVLTEQGVDAITGEPDGVDTANYVNPYPEFNQHIITRP